MNYNIKLLDCTLRDGGFVNDWNFGNGTFNAMFTRLKQARIDIIEIGFIDARRNFDPNRTIQPSVKDMDRIFKNKSQSASMVVGMIDYGTCPIDNISDKSDSFIDGIRVIFKKKDIEKALEFCKKIKEKGYKVFIQPVSITSYSNWEMLELVKRVNEIQPYAFSIVDTYGLMHKEKLFKFFYLIDGCLDESVCMGFHSHNNFQLAYSNSIELLSIDTERGLILDSSCYGMGKSAGNACTELFIPYLNEHCKKNYDINPVLEIIDTNIMPIYQQHFWGYSLKYFLAASNDCHPNYVKYLLEKKTLKVQDINYFLSKIEESHKLSFNEEYAENLYLDLQKQFVDDKDTLKQLAEQWRGKKILIMAPGMSLKNEQTKILEFINESNPVIVSMNFYTTQYNLDYIFISNSKRYNQLVDMGKKINEDQKLVITSNVNDYYTKADYVLNYNDLVNCVDEVSDTSVLMFLKLLTNIGINDVYIAGFDGFSVDGIQNYFERDFMFEANMEKYEKKNKAISTVLRQMNDIRIHFITKTCYEIGE